MTGLFQFFRNLDRNGQMFIEPFQVNEREAIPFAQEFLTKADFNRKPFKCTITRRFLTILSDGHISEQTRYC